MSGQIARAHTTKSNRARPLSGADRKVVFKSVVDNPFRVQWPSVNANIQNAVLARVVDMLSGVAEYNIGRGHRSKKRRRSKTHPEHPSKKAKVDLADAIARPTEVNVARDVSTEIDTTGTTAAPSILSSVTVGINEVTRKLEALAQSHRKTITTSAGHVQDVTLEKVPTAPSSRLVIACRADVDPPILVGHLPNLIAGCNSIDTHGAGTVRSSATWLVPMSKGAEHTLAEAIGLRRVSVLLIESSAPKFSALASLLENVPLLNVPWRSLADTEKELKFVPTHVKQIRTNCPKDMKAAKEKRSNERASAKERRDFHRSTPKRVIVA